LENKKKARTYFLRSVLKRKNKVEEKTSSSRMNKEQENTNVRAHKMMRGRVEPSTMPIMV
jgi:hypothetical protein